MSFTPTVNPDNRHICLCDTDCDTITIGGTVTHTFELPFKYSEYAASCKVLYSQGLHKVLEINVVSSMVNNNVITVKLTPTQTALFDFNSLSAECQLKISTLGGDTIFDNPHKIKILATLEDKE